MDGVLGVVAEVRKRSQVPIVLFGYYNPILSRGEARFAKEAADAGADGVLVVDLPPSEAESFHREVVSAGLDYIPLAAPTTGDWRLELIGDLATSFIYYVSVTGVTGSAGVDMAAAAERAAHVRQRTGKPIAVGFGVRSADDVARLSAHAEAVVVGTAVVAEVEGAKDPKAAVEAVALKVRSLAKGLVRS